MMPSFTWLPKWVSGLRYSDPAGYYDVNIKGLQHVLELAKEWGVQHFILGSSSSVYGINPNVPWKENDHDLRPISPYASTKLSGELLGHVYSQLYAIRFIALRFFTVYGPRQRPDLAIHKFTKRMLEGKEITLYGAGNTGRDYTYVGDIVDGIVAAIEYKKSMYEVINLASSTHVSLGKLVETLEDLLGIEARKIFLPEQPGDVPITWADTTKASKLIGFHPKTSLREGIDQFLSQFKSMHLK